MDLFKTKGYRFQVKNHENTTDIWLTPPEIVGSLGPFDLDPCAAVGQPWDTAETMYTIEDDGFNREWFGRVWMNPPYSEIERWMEKIYKHGDGISLTFARTETEFFHNYIWGKADAIFFIDGRITFLKPNGMKAPYNAGAPSVLIAYGDRNVDVLKNCKLRGFFIPLDAAFFSDEE